MIESLFSPAMDSIIQQTKIDIVRLGSYIQTMVISDSWDKFIQLCTKNSINVMNLNKF